MKIDKHKANYKAITRLEAIRIYKNLNQKESNVFK